MQWYSNQLKATHKKTLLLDFDPIIQQRSSLFTRIKENFKYMEKFKFFWYSNIYFLEIWE